MKKSFYIFLVFSFCFISCKTNKVLVKFKNATPEKFKNLEVNILGKEFKFENLKSGESTRFIKVDKTYSYCFARATTEKDTVTFFPTDYVGERLYTTGKIVMKITFEERQDSIRSLDIKLKRPIL